MEFGGCLEIDDMIPGVSVCTCYGLLSFAELGYVALRLLEAQCDT